MHNILIWLTQLLSQYGYPALFALLAVGVFGFPVPDETLLTFCGYLIFSGRLRFGLALLMGVGGSATGITLSYLIGVRFGHGIVVRFGKYVQLTPSRFDKLERTYQRVGAPLLVVGYFIPGIRHFTALVAGLTEVPFRKFAIFAYAGALIWVTTFLTVGYLVGDGWQHSSETIHHYVVWAIGVGLGVGVVWWLVRYFGGDRSRIQR
jgi:membrane protein DedA with SNARE-associated domain